jgi:hypothetical protein
MAILWEDHKLFKTLNSCDEDIKKALSGKEKKGIKIETYHEDD